MLKEKITRWLSNKGDVAFAIFAMLASFLTYSCMYAFRKPFTVATYEGFSFLGVDYKIWLIASQVIGYTISKFLGIKYVSELKSNKRAFYILGLVAIAEVALFLFWIVPRPYNIVFMFFNGLPLGMIWGAVFSYLEGRKLTELLGAGLCASFIVATGVVKSVGKLVMMNWHVSEFAMPFVTGLIFAIPLAISVYFLDAIPDPTEEDERLRTKRLPMNKQERRAFVKTFFWGILLLVVAYIFLTVFRDLRDDFSAEIWNSLGYGNDPAIFTVTQLPIALFSLVSLAFITFIRSNYKAFNIILLIIFVGFLIVIASTLLFSVDIISGKFWMIAVGAGLYLGYVPYNAFLYERFISAFKYVSNVGFLIYVSDAFGYFGSLSVFFYKNIFSPKISWIDFFKSMGIAFSVTGLVLITLSFFYFKIKYKQLAKNQ